MPKKKKNAASQPRKRGPQTGVYTGLVIPHVVGELNNRGTFTQSYIRRNAKKLRTAPTPAESRLEEILSSINGGVLKGRFRAQHPVSGRWIVDFFFPENRLAIEVDGSIHTTEAQRKRDRLKDNDCKRFDITLVRIQNSEVYADRDALLHKLRNGWRSALDRNNKIIGAEYIGRRPNQPSNGFMVANGSQASILSNNLEFSRWRIQEGQRKIVRRPYEPMRTSEVAPSDFVSRVIKAKSEGAKAKVMSASPRNCDLSREQCKICCKLIEMRRLEAIPDTNLCARCASIR